MPDGLRAIPTLTLRRQVHRLEQLLIAGSASPGDIDTYVLLGGELGRRALRLTASSERLDAVLDPRD